jgi:hypothetical protein
MLVRIAKAIGRWVLVRYLEYGRTKLVHYMEGRIDVFEARFKRARSRARRRWLAFRINRWKLAVKWLKTEGKRLAKKSVERLRKKLEEEGCALVGDLESFARFQRGRVRRAQRRAKRKTRRMRRKK